VRIAVDVSPLSHPRTGIGNYIRGSLAGVVEAAAGRHEVVAFAPTSLKGPERIRAALNGVDVPTRLWPLPASHAIRTAWSKIGHPAAERLLGPVDALLFTDWMYPPQRAGLRSTVIHDLVPLHHPELVTGRTRSMHTRKYENAARTCDVVFTNSHFTADDVAAMLGIPAERLVVAHPGLEPWHVVAGDRWHSERPYVLGIGTLEPRKNLARLVEAWRSLGGELDLVLAGGEGWGSQAGLDDPSITRLGYVPDEDVARLYRGAAVYVYPSLFEGFGMPVVEAMACGTPVVASTHPSLDEACGDAAVRVDPLDADAIAAGIREALEHREALVVAGLEHARPFTWRATGEVMLRAYEERT